MIKLSSPATRQFWPIPILHEDPQLLVLDKPAGLALTPDPAQPEQPSLIGLLHDGVDANKPWATERNLSFLSPAYRLDAEASGLVLFARSKPTLAHLTDQFGGQTPRLHCLVLVRGPEPPEAFEVRNKISASPDGQGLIRVDGKRGKRAVTRFALVEQFNGFFLLEATPLTHRPHQVRLHVRRQRLSVVGDPLYRGSPLFLSSLKPDYRQKKNRPERPLLNRPALHAHRLTIVHPTSTDTLTLTAPLPKDFSTSLKYLRRYASPLAAERLPAKP